MPTHSRKSALQRVVVGTLMLLVVTSLTAFAQFGVGLQSAWSDFHDPAGRFSLSVPPGWTYQEDQSTDDFVVFYGPGDYDLFYLEILELTHPQATAMDQAREAAERYSAGGLDNFAILQQPSAGRLAGKEASFMVYAFDDSLGARIVEGRAFAIHQGKAYTLAFADVAERFDASVATFNGVMEALRLLDPAPTTTATPGLGFGALTGTQSTAPTQGGTFGSAPVEQEPVTWAPLVYTSPDGRYQFTQPEGWELWEEQSTARGDYLEPWHTLFNWGNRPMTKSLFIWDYFDEWEQVGAQYEVVLGVIDNVPGSLNQAIDNLKSQIAGNLNHIYMTETGRVRIGSQTGLEVRIVTRPGMVEPWSEGPQWFKEYTFYTFKQGNALFVWAVPTEAVDIPAVKSALESFRWSGR